MAEVSVSVSGISGNHIASIPLGVQDKVQAVKDKLEEHTGVPRAYQELVLNGTNLGPAATLQELGASGEMKLTLVVQSPDAEHLESNYVAWEDHAASSRLLRFLLENRAHVPALLKSGYPPLDEVALAKNTDCLKLLLEARANPAEENSAALVNAIRGPFEGGVQMLLSARANPDAACPSSGDPALSVAVRTHDERLIRMLLEAKADPGQTNSYDGSDALTHAVITMRRVLCARRLLEARADPALAISWSDQTPYWKRGRRILLAAGVHPLQLVAARRRASAVTGPPPSS